MKLVGVIVEAFGERHVIDAPIMDPGCIMITSDPTQPHNEVRFGCSGPVQTVRLQDPAKDAGKLESPVSDGGIRA